MAVGQQRVVEKKPYHAVVSPHELGFAGGDLESLEMVLSGMQSVGGLLSLQGFGGEFDAIDSHRLSRNAAHHGEPDAHQPQ